MGNAAMFDNSIQRVDLHEYMLLRYADNLCLKLAIKDIATNDVARFQVPNLDIELTGNNGSIPVMHNVECKTEGEKNCKNLLCLELSTNLPDLPPLLQTMNPNWQNPTCHIKNIVVPAQQLNGYIVRAQSITETKRKGYVYSAIKPGHLLSHWHQGLGIWSLWNSDTLIRFIKQDEFRFDVTFGPNRNDDGSCWYSICILIPQEVAMQSGACYFARGNVTPQEYTEEQVKSLLEAL